MAIYAYTDRPRLGVSPVSEGSLNILSQPCRVFITGETYVYGTWECRDKDGKPRYDAKALCSRLQSPDFLDSCGAAAVTRHHQLSELFSATGGGLVCRYYRNEEPVYPRDVLYLRAILSRRFAVRAPTYEWSDWLQHRLPFMPDRMELVRIADERNQDATDVLDSLIRKTFPDLKLLTRSDP
jgi:hypothetical protein